MEVEDIKFKHKNGEIIITLNEWLKIWENIGTLKGDIQYYESKLKILEEKRGNNEQS